MTNQNPILDWRDFRGISRNELILMVVKKQEMETGMSHTKDIAIYKEQISKGIVKRRDLIELLIEK